MRTEALFTGTTSNPAYEQWRTTTHYDGATTTVVPPDGATPAQTVVDARGRTVALSQFLRDPVKHAAVRTLAGVLDLEEQTTRYHYDEAGRLDEVRDTDGNKWSYTHDKLGRQIEAVDPDTGKTVTEYDAAGQTMWVSNGANQKLFYTYDKLGRRTNVRQDSDTGAVRAKWTYDVLTSYAGANPPSAKGQVTSSTRIATSADGGGEFVTALTGFDKAYRPTGTVTVIPNTIKMAGLAGTYEQKATYTADGQVASTTYPAAGGLRKETVATHFDDDTSVAEWMGGGFGWGTYVASSRTDVFGRLSYLDLGNTYGTVVSYGYETGTSRLQRVKLDRERIGGTELDLGYAYDDAGNVLSVKDRPTATGRAADRQCYQYDALRRLTEAWTPASGNCGLTRSIPALGGAAPYWTSFEYDALGNRTSEIYRTRGLAGDIDGGQTTTMDYSYAGSRDLNADGDSTDAGEFAGPHAVTSITTDGPSGSTASTFTYDNAGRTLTQTQDSDYLTTKLSLGWDHETELASTSLATTVYAEPEPGSGDDDSDGDQSSGTGPDRGTGTTTTVAGRNLYTADGDRIVRTAPDGSITLYLGGQEITKAANGTVTGARYYRFGGQTVAMRTTNGLGGVTSLINDPHGTPLASVHNTNWTTTSVDKHYTLPFGEQRGGVSAPGDHEFLGKVRDEATGLTLVGARWYDETVGRFLTVDPRMDFMDPRTWNGYAYANSNPLTYSDPSGLSWWDNAASFFKGTVGGYFGAINSQIKSAVNTVKSIPRVVKSAPREIVRRSASALSTASSCAGGSKGSCGQIIVVGAMVADRLLRPRQDVGERFKENAISTAYAAVHGDWEGAGEATGAAGWEGTKYGAEIADLVVGSHGLISAAKTAAKAAGESIETLAKAAGRACSFAGSTLVLMADGLRKSIQDIQVGDEVIATDPETGEQNSQEVTHVWVHQDDLFEFEVDGELIVTTEDHPFWSVTDRAWEGTEELATGERVLTADGRKLTVTRSVDFGTGRLAAAYNLTVAGLHTYHVGRGDVVVHNTGVGNPHLQNLIDAMAHGVGRADAVGDGTALAAADHQARTGELVNGVDHLASTAPYRTRLVKMLDGTAQFKPRGGKKQTISLNAQDRAIAQVMLQAIDDAHAGTYKGSWSAYGVGC